LANCWNCDGAGGLELVREDLRISKRHTLTDEQWHGIKDLVPGTDGDPGRSGRNNRLCIEAVVYVLKTGVPWRHLQERFGNWNSVWRRCDRWCENGIWKQIVKELSQPDLEEQQIDSISIKVHLPTIGGRRASNKKKTMQIVAEFLAVLAED